MTPAEWYLRLRAKQALSRGERALAAGSVDAAVQAFNEASAQASQAPELRRQAHEQAASALLGADRRSESVPHLRVLTELCPENALSWRRLAETLDGLGRRQDSIDAWQDVLSHGGEDPHVRERLLQLLWAENRRDEALAQARALAKGAAATDTGPWRRFAKLLEEAGRSEDAISAWLRVLKVEPDDASVHERLVQDFSSLGRKAKTVPHVRALARLTPHKLKSWTRLAWLLESEGDVEGALDAWRSAIENAPASIDPHREALRLLEQLDREADALPHVRALALDAGDDPGLWRRLAVGLDRFGPADEALDAWRRVVDLSPGDLEAHEAAIRLLDGLGRRSESVAHFRALSDLRRDKLKPQKELAVRLQEIGDLEGTFEVWGRIADLQPNLAEAHEQRAALAFQLDRPAEATPHLRILASLSPKSPAPWARLARQLQAQGELEEAVDAWKRASKRGSGDLEPDRELAAILQALGRTPEAIAHLRIIALKTAGESEPWKRLAAALEAHGDTEAALDAWRKAARADVEDVEVHQAIVRLLDARGQRSQSVRHLQAIADLCPDQPEPQREFARRLREVGKGKASILTWRRVLDLAPEDLEAHKALAALHLELGALGDAVPHLRTIAQSEPQAAVKHWRRLADVLEQLGDPLAELDARMESVRADARDTDAHGRAAELLQGMGRHAEAVPHLRAVAEARPLEAKPWQRLARGLHEAGDTQGEIETWRYVLTLDADDPEAHERLADALSGLCLWGQAAPHLRAVAERAGAKSKLWQRFARAVQRSAPAEAAIAAWTRVLELEPDDLEGNEEMARLLGQLGRTSEMLVHLKRLADAAPERAELWRRLSPIASIRNEADVQREIDWWRLVLEVAPEDEETRERLALFLCGVGRKDEALPGLKALAEAAPSNWLRWKRLARCAEFVGDVDLASNAWRQVLLIRGDDAEAGERLGAPDPAQNVSRSRKKQTQGA